MALAIGDQVGDYQVVALIGAGGMGRVYKVRSIISNRDEAMKVLLPDLTSEPDLAARFMAEIRTLAGLDHPNIAQLRTAFQYQNQLVMIMEFVEGVTLEKLGTEASIPLDQLLDYATQVLSALSFAHSHGVIHRDIKPANIMITTHGQVKLMDFGIAKNPDEMHLTRPGMTIGSVYYMSPEQVRGGTVDARSDLYSFGITLYELITRRKPFQADTSYSVLNAQLNEAPIPPIQVNPEVPQALNDIVLHALAKSPEARFQTAQEFHDALKALRMQFAAGAVAQPSSLPSFTPVFAPVSPTAFSPTVAGFTPTGAAAPIPPSAAAPPAFAPVATPKPVASAASRSHRGLWIGLGALAALLALVAIAVVLPHVFKTFAQQRGTQTPPASDTSTAASSAPSTSPASNPAPSTADGTTAPADTGTAPPADGEGKPANPDQPGKPAQHAQGSGGSHAGASSGSSAHGDQGSGSGGAESQTGTSNADNSASAGPSQAQIREAHDKLMNIESRADAARSGVQSIRSQQQAQGLDIRGDILAAMNRMNNDLKEAHAAMDRNDLQTADEYMDRADKETAKLESFLGR